MATSEQVRRLIDSHRRGDERAFESVLRDLASKADPAADVVQDTLALDLERIATDRRTQRRPLAVGHLRPLPLGRDDWPLVTLHEPQVRFSDLTLAPAITEVLDAVIEEHRRREVLLARGLAPRTRILLTGPSGTGKTRTAEAMAAEIGVPIARVRLAAVVSSYLGETSRHLEQILDFASHGTWVLVFDEIDMLGTTRDRDDHGEIRRVVTTFLQTLEEAHSDNLIVATTNHGAALDEALWRRFDEVVPFQLPTKIQIQELLKVKLRRMPGRVNRENVAKGLVGLSQAEVEMVCLDAMREAVLAGRTALRTEDLLKHARQRRSRLQEAGKSLT